MKRQKWRVLLLAMVRILLWNDYVLAENKNFEALPSHEFVGAKICSTCHKKPEQGEQMAIWEKTGHARAFETLKTDEAKAIGAAWSIEKPEESSKCLKCHSTAYWFSENNVTSKISPEEGVSCESCHGPGKDYLKKTIMQDRTQALANGLIIPDENLCRKCHNEESPTYKPFDYTERWDAIKHPIP